MARKRKGLAGEALEQLGQQQVGEETVSVKAVDLQGLLSTVDKLTQEIAILKNPESAPDLPTVKIKKARVHFYKGEVITAVGRAWQAPPINGEAKMRLEIYIGDQKHEVDLKAYREDHESAGFTSQPCEIKEIVTLDQGEKIYGKVEKVDVDYDNFRSISRGTVPLKVVTPKYSYIMDVNGQEIAVDPLALN